MLRSDLNDFLEYRAFARTIHEVVILDKPAKPLEITHVEDDDSTAIVTLLDVASPDEHVLARSERWNNRIGNLPEKPHGFRIFQDRKVFEGSLDEVVHAGGPLLVVLDRALPVAALLEETDTLFSRFPRGRSFLSESDNFRNGILILELRLEIRKDSCVELHYWVHMECTMRW